MTAERTKQCTRCGETKPWSEFYAKTKWPDGSMRTPRCYCRECDNAKRNDAYHRLHETDPDRFRSMWLRKYYRLKEDPERYGVVLEQSREWKRRRYGHKPASREGTPIRSGDLLPAAPFVEWVESVMRHRGTDLQTTATNLGMGEKTLRRLLREGQATVDLSTVDEALCREGTRTLCDLYPLALNTQGE